MPEGVGYPAGQGLMKKQPEQSAAAVDDGPAPNVSPEEQAQYEQFVLTAVNFIGQPEVTPAIVQRLQATEDPVSNLANAALMVVKRVEDAAAKKGEQINPDVLLHGGEAVVSEIADFAAEVGLVDFTQEQIDGAFYQAVDQYREMAQREGRIDQQAVKADFDQIVAADQNGALEQVLPGIEQAAQPQAAAPEEENSGLVPRR